MLSDGGKRVQSSASCRTKNLMGEYGVRVVIEGKERKRRQSAFKWGDTASWSWQVRGITAVLCPPLPLSNRYEKGVGISEKGGKNLLA